MNILLLDNRDSFTWNLEHLLTAVAAPRGGRVQVAPYDTEALARPGALRGRDLVVLSPGPGCPDDYPGYEALRAWDGPVLGVCLGMQILNALEGGTTAPLPGCVHGHADTAHVWGRHWTVARYHSLWCDHVAPAFEVVGTLGPRAPDVAHGAAPPVPMALRHRRRPWLGFQFHPESFLTPHGDELVRLALDDLGLR